MNKNQLTLVALIGLLAFTESALAYVGPGAGVSLIGALIGLVVAIATALWVLFSHPIKKMLKNKKPAVDDPEANVEDDEQKKESVS